MKFSVSEEVFHALPNVCFGVVVAKGIDNTRTYPHIEELLQSGVAGAEERYADNKVKDDPAILPYREAFQALSINPNKFMSSIEALFTRVSKGKGLPSINPIVDIGNAMSLKYVLPMGAHDIVQMEGCDMQVRFSRADDTFLPFGETDAEQMPDGELVYVVDGKVRTRRWIWRQSEIGKIGPATRDIFFPIDGFLDANKEAVLSARAELAALCGSIFGCTDVRVGFVDQDAREMEL